MDLKRLKEHLSEMIDLCEKVSEKYLLNYKVELSGFSDRKRAVSVYFYDHRADDQYVIQTLGFTRDEIKYCVSKLELILKEGFKNG